MQLVTCPERQWRLLKKVLYAIPEQQDIYGLGMVNVVELIADQIRAASDFLDTPIYIEDKQVVIYFRGEPLPVPKQSFKRILLWISLRVGV